MKKLRVGIIGATGMVGQQFLRLLENHPWFDVVCLAASSRSAGKAYAEAVAGKWKLETSVPEYAKAVLVKDALADRAEITAMVDIIFCAVDMDKAAIRDLETSYAERGAAVISNNSAHRWTDDVPMIIPEVNPEHTGLIDIQRKKHGWGTGLIAVKPNCSIQSYTAVLTALKAFQPYEVQVTSLQAVSGAGRNLAVWPEMVDNAMPFIAGEEEKSEREPLQIWGTIKGGKITQATHLKIAATCIRVPVSNGHMADVSVNFKSTPSKEELIRAMEEFNNPLKKLNLPSAPAQLIHYLSEDDRPQIKLDRDTEKGMAVSVGRLRKLAEESPYQWRFISLAHNTIRGAAGGAILVAELLVAQGYITPRN